MSETKRPRLFLIAGEASGDLHGSSLARQILLQQPDLALRGMGGDRMSAAGVELIQHIEGASFMGFVEVVRHLPTIWRLFRKLQADILDWRPDALILIDYPGFNLRMAKFARKHGIRVIYYISPQVWAWNPGRAHRMRQLIDRLIVILPFEPDFFAQYGMEAHFVGHPLLDVLPPAPPSLCGDFSYLKGNRPLVALLPGSRLQEVERMLPVMLEVVNARQDFDFVLAIASNLKPEVMVPGNLLPNLRWVQGSTYEVLGLADAALVTSGTATLETALLGVPQVVCYRGNWLSYQIARRLIRVPYISLVNLILNRSVVPELIQQEMNFERIMHELDALLYDTGRRSYIAAAYAELRERLQNRGASERAARLILDFVQNESLASAAWAGIK